MNKKIVSIAIAVIRNKYGQYLLTLRSQNDPEDKGFLNCWQIPGGGVLTNESLKEAVLREVYEELKIKVRIIKKLDKVFDSRRNNWHGRLFCFICQMENSKEKIFLNKEASEYKWFYPNEIKNLKAFPSCYEIVCQAEEFFNCARGES